jgi:hypothetical protein
MAVVSRRIVLWIAKSACAIGISFIVVSPRIGRIGVGDTVAALDHFADASYRVVSPD